ncbi:MAG: nicotinate-nicotinamide nucleotide adenylyltransferase, partial [Bdellovibrionota bacterium]
MFENPRVHHVIVIPAASPPHKPCLATAERRLAMARLNFALPEVEIQDRELRRPGPSYTFDTLLEFKKE